MHSVSCTVEYNIICSHITSIFQDRVTEYAKQLTLCWHCCSTWLYFKRYIIKGIWIIECIVNFFPIIINCGSCSTSWWQRTSTQLGIHLKWKKVQRPFLQTRRKRVGSLIVWADCSRDHIRTIQRREPKEGDHLKEQAVMLETCIMVSNAVLGRVCDHLFIWSLHTTTFPQTLFSVRMELKSQQEGSQILFHQDQWPNMILHL